MKKRNRILQVVMAIGIMLCVCGCQADDGSGSSAADNVSTQTPAGGDKVDGAGDVNTEGNQGNITEGNTENGYFFVTGGVTVGVDMDMDELVSELAEAKSVFEAPSCAGEGVDYVYNFGSYQIETYPAADGKNRIGFITLKDDMVATAEGIDMSMTKGDVIQTYGEDYEEIGDGITYEKDGTKLNFIFNGDDIISIEYASAVVG